MHLVQAIPDAPCRPCRRPGGWSSMPASRSSAPYAHFQSQGDCVLQPRVARHELPWVCPAYDFQPQRGCGPFRGSRGRVPQPFQGSNHRVRFPRVARSSQPWAWGRNPLGILRGLGRQQIRVTSSLSYRTGSGPTPPTCLFKSLTRSSESSTGSLESSTNAFSSLLGGQSRQLGRPSRRAVRQSRRLNSTVVNLNVRPIESGAKVTDLNARLIRYGVKVVKSGLGEAIGLGLSSPHAACQHPPRLRGADFGLGTSDFHP